MWRSTDEVGRVDFGQIAPGVWRVVIADSTMTIATRDGADPEFTITGGDRRTFDLRLLERKRRVVFLPERAP